jgi:ABC-type branched-subunit amino acid transport system substrate-binding protein
MWDWRDARVRQAGPAVAGLTAAVLLAGAACQEEDDDRVLVVGSLLPRTGYNANADWVMAAQLAADEIDQALDWAPYPDGLRIRWISRNSASRPDLVRRYTRELIAGGAKILTGEGSLSVLGNAENYASDDPLATAMICASCTSPDINNRQARHDDPQIEQGLRDPDGWLFRTAPTATRQGAIAARKMATFGDRGDTNNDGFVKVVLLCTTDSDCIGAQDATAVAARRKAALDTLTEQLPNPGCFNVCADPALQNDTTACAAACSANPGCRFDPTLATCGAERVIFEFLLIGQFTPADSPEWASMLERAFDRTTDIDGFSLAPGATVESPESPGTTFVEASAPDPLGLQGPDFIWNQALSVPSLSLIRAYVGGDYATSHPTTKFVNHDPFHRNSIRLLLGNDGNGLEGVAMAPWSRDASGQRFVNAHRERTGSLPTSFDAHYYDAVVLAMLATIKAARPLPDPRKVTGAQVRDALLTLDDPAGIPVGTGPYELARAIALIRREQPINYQGASGSCDFTDAAGAGSGGDVGMSEILYWRIENGEFSYKELYDCRQTASNCPMQPLSP